MSENMDKQAKVIWWVIVVIGLAVLGAVAMSGCKAVYGLGADLQDWTRPYAEPEE